MQNLGQTWIFYKAGETWLTQAKHDPVDPDDLDDSTQLQHWSIQICQEKLPHYNYWVTFPQVRHTPHI